VVELVSDILSHAVGEGAEAVALSCPLCAFNLDYRQVEVRRLHPDLEGIPIFYFTQLMALAFGLDERYYGFDQNHIDPRPLLREKSLLGI
jgi:heterodisulfide reductase subunit B